MSNYKLSDPLFKYLIYKTDTEVFIKINSGVALCVYANDQEYIGVTKPLKSLTWVDPKDLRDVLGQFLLNIALSDDVSKKLQSYNITKYSEFSGLTIDGVVDGFIEKLQQYDDIEFYGTPREMFEDMFRDDLVDYLYELKAK